jgi:hypothetical protein
MLFKTRNPARFLKNGRFKVSVYGLGHVGASVAAVWLRAGAHVIGVDKSSDVVNNARRGRSHIGEPGVEDAFKKALRKKRFEVTTDVVSASKSSDFKIMTVPVGLLGSIADLSAVNDVTASIATGLKNGDLVSFNATVPPGTTEEIVLPTLERVSGLKCEKDFGLIYTPERIYEGRAIRDMEENYPTVVAGAGPQSLKVGAMLYSVIAKKGVIKMNTIRSAEFEKVCEGVYRDVNIALANELAKVAERLGVDFWQARNAANSQPYCNLHKPGTGVGGACIPVYPHFLIEVADKMKIDSDIAKLARQLNLLMPKYCVAEALKLLHGSGKSINGANVVVLGLAFRGGVSDARLSPTYDVIEELLKSGCRIILHDPYVSSDDKVPSSVMLTSKLEHALKNADLIFIATDHPQYAKLNEKILSKVSSSDAVVYDGRGILDPKGFTKTRFAKIGRKET